MVVVLIALCAFLQLTAKEIPSQFHAITDAERREIVDLIDLAQKQVEVFTADMQGEPLPLRSGAVKPGQTIALDIEQVSDVVEALESYQHKLSDLQYRSVLQSQEGEYLSALNEAIRQLNLLRHQHDQVVSGGKVARSLVVPLSIAIAAFSLVVVADMLFGDGSIRWGRALQVALAAGLIAGVITYRKEIISVGAGVLRGRSAAANN